MRLDPTARRLVAWTLLALAGCAGGSKGGTQAGDPPAAEAPAPEPTSEDAAAEPPPEDEGAPMGDEAGSDIDRSAVVDRVGGTWTYAKDPSGEVAFDDLYTNSQVVITDQTYSFALEDMDGLEGSWTPVEWGEDGGQLKIDFGDGRVATMGFSVRRDDSGAVSGLVVSASDGQGSRYYEKAEG